MILVIGGFAAGKRGWVAQHLGYGPDDFSSDPASESPVLFDLQDHDAGLGADDLSGHEVIICDEVGCGLVPIEAADRASREHTGRLCCELAARADCVVRIVCGIGTCIKGELPTRDFQGAPESR